MKKITTIPMFLILLMSTNSCGVTNHVRYDNADLYHVLHGDENFANINSIEINWVRGNVTVTTSSLYETIHISETCKGNYEDKYLAHCYSNDGELLIQYCESGTSLINDYEKSITVYVPVNYTLEDIDVDFISGQCLIEKVDSNDIDVDFTSGELVINECVSDKIDCSYTSGSVDILQGVVREIEVNYTSGDLFIKALDTLKELEVNFTSGSTILSLPENILGYRAKISSTTGNYVSQFGYDKSGSNYVYGDGSLSLGFNHTSGNITINKYSIS